MTEAAGTPEAVGSEPVVSETVGSEPVVSETVSSEAGRKPSASTVDGDRTSEFRRAPQWLRRVFGSPDFFSLWVAQVVSALGDWIGFLAVVSLASAISGKPEAATALVTTARVAPGLFLAPLAGVVVDRFDRRKVMMVSDLARFGVFAMLPFVRTLWGLVLASLVLEVFTMLWSPAKEALVPAIVPRDRLASANSLSLVAAYGTFPLAGFLQFGLKVGNDHLAGVSWLRPLQFGAGLGDTQALAFYFNAGTFLFTLMIVWWFVHPKAGLLGVRGVVGDGQGGVSDLIQGIREGWTYIFINPVVRSVHVGLAAGLLGGAMLIPLGPVFSAKVIGDPTKFSLFITALGMGVAVGVGFVSAMQSRLPHKGVFVLSLFVASGALIFSASMASFWPAAMAVFVLGLCAGSVYVLGFTLLQTHTDDEVRGRIFSTLLTLVRLCVLLALLLGPLLAALFDTVLTRVLATRADGIPRIGWGRASIAVPGVRVTLWLAGVIILGAAILAARSVGLTFRKSIVSIRDQTSARHGTGRHRLPGVASVGGTVGVTPGMGTLDAAGVLSPEGVETPTGCVEDVGASDAGEYRTGGG